MRRAKVAKDTKAPSDGQILRDAAGDADRRLHRRRDGPGRPRRARPRRKDDIKRRLLAAQELVLEARPDRRSTTPESRQRSPRSIASSIARASSWSAIYGMASPPAGRRGRVRRAAARKPSPDGARFELRAIKLFIDGAMGSRGGLLVRALPR